MAGKLLTQHGIIHFVLHDRVVKFAHHILDGNHFTALESGALHDVRVKFLSISRNANLARIDENAIRAMPDLQVRTPRERERERERERDSFPSKGAITNVSQFAFHPP